MAEFGSLYGGYVARQKMNQDAETQQLGQMGALQGLLQKIQAEEQEKKYRGALESLGPNATPEQMLTVARPHMSANNLASLIQTAQTKKETSDQTRQIAMARLQQQVSHQAGELMHKARTAATAEERFHWQQQMDVLKAEAQKQASQIAAGRYNYETGISVAPFRGTVPTPSTGGQPSPTQAPPPVSGGLPTDAQFTQMPEFAALPPQAQEMLRNQLGGGGQVRVQVAPDGAATDVRGAYSPPSAPQSLAALAAPAAPVDREIARLPPSVTGGGLASLMPQTAPTLPAPVMGGAGGTAPVTLSPRKQMEVEAARQKSLAMQSAAPQRSSEALRDDVYYQIIHGKPRPGSIPTGRAGEGNAYRAQFADELRKVATELNMSPEDLAVKGAENKTKFAALSAIEKDLVAIRPYKDMLKMNGDIAIELAKKAIATDAQLANKPINWLRQNLSDNPDVAEFLAQAQIVSTESARVLNNPRLVGQLTDSARHEMQGIINGNMPLNAFTRVVKRMQTDGDNRVSAMENQRARTMGEISGRPQRAPSTDIPEFATEAEAEKAGLKPGTRIKIGGRPGTWQ